MSFSNTLPCRLLTDQVSRFTKSISGCLCAKPYGLRAHVIQTDHHDHRITEAQPGRKGLWDGVPQIECDPYELVYSFDRYQTSAGEDSSLCLPHRKTPEPQAQKDYTSDTFFESAWKDPLRARNHCLCSDHHLEVLQPGYEECLSRKPGPEKEGDVVSLGWSSLAQAGSSGRTDNSAAEYCSSVGSLEGSSGVPLGPIRWGGKWKSSGYRILEP